MAIGDPTGSELPSGTSSSWSTPELKDSTSIFTFSVSISATTSPIETLSPAFLSQRTSLASVESAPVLGTTIVLGIAYPFPMPGRAAHVPL
jgi:hypothetical protein